MSEKILVPILGESITEATVSKWLKNQGESIQVDEPIVELETDKVNLEVPSPISGILSKINVKNGETVAVGAVLGLIDEKDNKSIQQKIKKITPKEKENNVVNLEIAKKKEPRIFNEENISIAPKKDPLILTNEVEPLILTNEIKKEKSLEAKEINENLSPAVRKIVVENNIDIEKVNRTGKGGRILKGDLIDMMGTNPQPSERKIKYGQEERIKMTRLRQTIAKRLKQAQENAALLTTFNEVDMTKIIEMRKENQEDFQSKYGIKLGFMSFFVKACVSALQEYPDINTQVDKDEIVYHHYYDIGVAVGSEKGLFVPVIRNADQLSYAEIEKDLKMYAEKARSGTISIDEMQGGTFTISNGGVYGSMLSTPILNPPQSGILGMHNIQKRAVVVDDQIVIRPIMYLALSYDHRVVDGKNSIAFLVHIKKKLETPERFLLDL